MSGNQKRENVLFSATGSLSNLELLGALSARLAHSLSNQLSVISGNICVAASGKSDSETKAAALHSAVQAATVAGTLLGEFVDLRRAINIDSGSTTLQELAALLKTWAEERPGWTFESSVKSKENLSIGMPWSRLAFILSSIQAESISGPGTISLSEINSARNPFLHIEFPGGTTFLQITLLAKSANVIDWNEVRANFKHQRLAASFELLHSVGAWPESRASQAGIELGLTFPLQ
jgi:hypothetical protein